MSLPSKFAAPVAQVAGGASFGNAYPVTPSDSTALTTAAAALYVGGTGTVKVLTIGGQTVTFSGVPAGAVLPIACSQVFATGTSATLIVALW